MAINYYYIDDDPLSTITETAKGLSINPQILNIIPYQHKKWDDEIEFLIKNQTKFDGLLLDWNLNRKNESGDEANFNVEALAQQIRRLIIENKKLKKDFPIVLCSANYRFKKVFNKELTSHDLFDAIYEKDDFNDNQKEVIVQLADLGNGYRKIESLKKLDDILSAVFGDIKIEDIDYRILDSIKILIKGNKPSHEITRFMLIKVIKNNGVLIDKYLLASRLGVDILTEVNLEDWDKLLKKLETLKYNGIFSSGWERWWMNKLHSWWISNFENQLGSLSGSERVKLLNDKFKLNLKPANLAPNCNSEYFWNICKETNVPIAYQDSVISSSSLDKPSWQDDEYFSINIAVQKNASEVHALERDRLKKLKVLHSKNRKNETK